MKAYYNENDPKAAQWLRNLIDAGLIPAGHVDDRSIANVRASDLDGFTQCHFFAGVAGWSLALGRALWPDDREVWTGSCPCQPFSCAGEQKGESDERHLWPEFRRLIADRRPPTIFGEQVASKLGREWLAGVRADLEALGYAVGSADLCAAGTGAPHIRQRLFWVADSDCRGRRETGERGRLVEVCRAKAVERLQAEEPGAHVGMGDAAIGGLGINGSASGRSGHADEPIQTCGLVNTNRAAKERLRPVGVPVESEQEAGRSGDAGAWSDYELVECADGKARRVEPGTFPLAHGVPGRVVKLRAYGNAIVPQVAAEFIAAFMETEAA